MYLCAMEQSQDTRSLILKAVYQAMWKHGYQGTRADKVVQELGITKGALYHYFPGKQQLGYALVEELLAPAYLSTWRTLETHKGTPWERLQALVVKLESNLTPENVVLGCPLNNLSQEMSPLDEGFRIRLAHVMQQMHQIAATTLSAAVKAGELAPWVEPEAAAWQLISTVEGAFGTAKVQANPALFGAVVQGFLHSLRCSVATPLALPLENMQT
jgi:AcrR family transcriptional regulator